MVHIDVRKIACSPMILGTGLGCALACCLIPLGFAIEVKAIQQTLLFPGAHVAHAMYGRGSDGLILWAVLSHFAFYATAGFFAVLLAKSVRAKKG